MPKGLIYESHYKRRSIITEDHPILKQYFEVQLKEF
jgi:hypothetical protein